MEGPLQPVGRPAAPELKDFHGHAELVKHGNHDTQITNMLINTAHSATLMICPWPYDNL
jgi:hypothetical protein